MLKNVHLPGYEPFEAQICKKACIPMLQQRGLCRLHFFSFSIARVPARTCYPCHPKLCMVTTQFECWPTRRVLPEEHGCSLVYIPSAAHEGCPTRGGRPRVCAEDIYWGNRQVGSLSPHGLYRRQLLQVGVCCLSIDTTKHHASLSSHLRERE